MQDEMQEESNTKRLEHLQAIRGMSDVLPEQSIYWRHLEKQLIHIAECYGYQEIRYPIVEQTALFKRGVGETTDIVEKEMYTFEDRNGDSLTLRPEGTAGCVRAGIEHGLLYNQIQRLWYLGPMFRHERPQKGRYRQFHQFGIEAFGIATPDIDAEIILLSARIWQALNLQNQVVLQLNSLGSAAARAQYRARLVEYFSQHLELLDEDSRRRLSTNPLRILDSKNPAMQELIANAPVLTESLDEASARDFAQLRKYLDAAHVPYVINPRLVRGLDYYGGTVFEWVTDKLGAQGAVCSGGRYDTLVELLGGKATPAIGFGLGMERVLALLEAVLELNVAVDAYMIVVGEAAEKQGLLLAEQLRQDLPDLKLILNCGGGNFKSQFKRADKSHAKLACILGPEEVESQTIGIKFLREERPQETVSWNDIAQYLRNLQQ